MIIITDNTHEELDERLHDTDFLVCSVGTLAYLSVECEFNRKSIDGIMEELGVHDVSVVGILDDLQSNEMRLLGTI